jgi:flagellar protein FlgJ
VSSNALNTFNFADFQGFAALRRDAAKDTPEARRAVAQQFEAMFLNQLLSQMRDASGIENGLIDEQKLRPYQSMYDQQLALTLSQHGGIGLADSIVRQLGGSVASHVQRSNDGAFSLSRGAVLHRAPDRTRAATGAVPAAPEPAKEPAPADFRPATPAEFVSAVWPHAQRAAAALGVDPEVLVAQAALETGWGTRQIPGPDGSSSYNLFGVKASGTWEGPHVQVATLEYEGGVPEKRREAFRVYASLNEGFSDYVRLVSGQARYRGALTADTAEGYLRGLEAGGYATDPAYAEKVLAIVRRGLPGRTDQVTGTAADNNMEQSAASADVAGPAQVKRAASPTGQGVVL